MTNSKLHFLRFSFKNKTISFPRFDRVKKKVLFLLFLSRRLFSSSFSPSRFRALAVNTPRPWIAKKRVNNTCANADALGTAKKYFRQCLSKGGETWFAAKFLSASSVRPEIYETGKWLKIYFSTLYIFSQAVCEKTFSQQRKLTPQTLGFVLGGAFYFFVSSPWLDARVWLNCVWFSTVQRARQREGNFQHLFGLIITTMQTQEERSSHTFEPSKSDTKKRQEMEGRSH